MTETNYTTLRTADMTSTSKYTYSLLNNSQCVCNMASQFKLKALREGRARKIPLELKSFFLILRL